jgi:hypothetical protein
VAYVLGYFEPEIDPAICLIDRAEAQPKLCN